MTQASCKCKAAVLVAPRKIETRVYETPKIKPKDTLLKVEMAGICGTDIHMVYSEDPWPGERGWFEMVYPQILGHETVGTIAEMGSKAWRVDVTKRSLEVGDRVTLLSGMDPSATHPLLYGWGRGWADYRYLYGEYDGLYKFPCEIPPEICVLIEPLSVGVKAVERALEPTESAVPKGIGPGKTVVVQGSGPIGLMIIILAKLRGARKIVVVGAPATRLDMCRSFGANHIVNI